MDRLEPFRERVFARVRPLGAEHVPLARACGRILAERVVALRAAPPFTCSAMDGFAIRSDDVGRAEPLEVIATVYAGQVPSERLSPGQAARIFTGAPLPEGADTVVREEAARLEGDRVCFTGPIRLGEHVRREGEDVPLGGEALAAGLRLGPRQLGLCSAIGVKELRVARPPRVLVLSTGDEVVSGRTPDSNGVAVGEALRVLGCELARGSVGDDLDAVVEALRGGLESNDAVVTIGGVSVGQKDFVPLAVDRLGGERIVHGVPMKPGKPFLFAEALGKPIFGLPGSPSACLVAFEVFARPALLRMSGRARVERTALWLRLAEPVSGRPGRARFLWAAVEGDGRVRPLGRDAAQVRGPALADGLIHLPEGQGELAAGDEVRVLLLDPDAP